VLPGKRICRRRRAVTPPQWKLFRLVKENTAGRKWNKSEIGSNKLALVRIQKEIGAMNIFASLF